MVVWNFCINYISYALDITRVESSILLIFILMGATIRSFYPWERKWKSEKTKDKNGNDVTIHSKLK